jgi:hypothetical protein
MRHHRSVLVLPLILALGAASSASAADTVVAHVQRPTAIRTYTDIEVFSAFEGTLLEGGVHHLAILREGKVELLPVGPSPTPFAADIGPDRNGRPQLVYARCTGRDPGTGRNLGCDLFTFPLAGGAGEQPVGAANTSRNEIAPTLWNGRIAFARESKDGSRTVVYTRRLTDPPGRRSKRLPGIPFGARFPGIPGKRIRSGEVTELELYRDRLAQVVTYPQGLSEIRVVRISSHRTRLIARVGVGEGGQYFAGIGFADGYLAWARGGELAGIYRHRFSTGELSHAAFPRIVDFLVIGLAPFTPTGAYMVDWQPGSADGCGGEDEVPPAGLPLVRPCQVIRSDRLKFRPFRR